MAKIKVTVYRTFGSYKKEDMFIYPYSEYEALSIYIKHILINGNFDRITIERKDK